MMTSKLSFTPSHKLINNNPILDLLLQSDPPFEDILRNQTCVKLFRCGNIEILEYFIKNINLLLEIALRDDNSQISLNAFNVFASENRRFTLALLQMNDLNAKFKKILTGNPSYLTLSRLSSILVICFNICPFKSIQTFEQLEYLFPYCSFQPVLALFFNLVVTNDSDGKFFGYISKQELVPKLLDQIQNAPSTIGPNQERIISLFHLVRTFCLSPQIRNFFKTPEILQIILRPFDDPDIVILNAQWSIILNLTDESTLPFLVDVIPQAIAIISNSTEHFSRYQILCIDFLAKLLDISNDPSFTVNFLSLDICQIIKILILTFPNHSILHLHIMKLLKSMIAKPDLIEYVISEFLPFLIELSKQRENILLCSFSWNLINELIEIDSTESVKKSIDEDALKGIQAFIDLSLNDYGGEIPKVNNSILLTPISSEQLFMLFKKMH